MPLRPSLKTAGGTGLLRGEIPITSMAGLSGTLQKYTAPVTILALWASYCQPCLRELPYLNELYRKHRNDPDVAVLAINVDEPDKLLQAKNVTAPLKLSLPLLVDSARAFRRRLNGFLGKNQEDRNVPLPLLLVVDGSSHVWSEMGLPIELTEEQFLTDKARLIAQAKAGELKERKPDLARQVSTPALIQLRYPNPAKPEPNR